MVDCLRASAGWLAATRAGKVSASFGSPERAVLRKAARLLLHGLQSALKHAGDLEGPDQKELWQLDRAIVSLLAGGASYKEAARRLRLSYGTVHTRIKVLYKRFGVHSKLALIELFRELEWT